jgi:hypothetical protein
MTSFTFLTPNSLTQREFLALRENRFELHCLKMELESLASGGPGFSGPGVIRQDSDGQLHFTLYAKEALSASEFLRRINRGMNLPLGSIIPKSEFYRLSAEDSKGREWICDQVSPGTDSSSGQGTICTGNLAEITCLNEGLDEAKDFLYLEIFDNTKLPYNAQTIVNKNVAGKESVSISLNVLQFSTHGIEFLIQQEEMSLFLTAKSTDLQFVDFFETKVIEALQFVLARPLRWSVMIKQSNENTLTCIRNVRPDNLKYDVQPPIALSLDHIDEFCEIFGRYLGHVLKYPGNKLHPISAQMRSICRASIGTIETKSLILSVAVESILKHVYETKFQLSSEEEEWINKAQGYFCSWGGPENLSKRIAGLFSMLHTPSASMRLYELVELSAIKDEHRRAWKTLRDKLAHGEALGSNSLQEFLELSNTVLVLFYHLVFFAIGYEGKYTDYSTIGWPTKDYIVTPSTDENVT